MDDATTGFVKTRWLFGSFRSRLRAWGSQVRLTGVASCARRQRGAKRASLWVWRFGSLLLTLLASCSSRAIGQESECYAKLKAADVRFERVPATKAAGVEWPIKLTGPVDGVKIYGGRKNAPTNYLDCRLALALVEWAPLLKRQGVEGLQHYSMYRHESTVGSSTKSSGHSLGRAIDVAFFDLGDGTRLSVLDDWKNRRRGAAPCELRSSDDAEKLMRDLVCEASEHRIFHMILTPHYNDAHKNHLHLEVGDPRTDAWVD